MANATEYGQRSAQADLKMESGQNSGTQRQLLIPAQPRDPMRAQHGQPDTGSLPSDAQRQAPSLFLPQAPSMSNPEQENPFRSQLFTQTAPSVHPAQQQQPQHHHSSTLLLQASSSEAQVKQSSIPRVGSHNMLALGSSGLTTQHQHMTMGPGSRHDGDIDHEEIKVPKYKVTSQFGREQGVRVRNRGIKAVQSLQNLTSYAQEEMTRVVSERTVCYCSNFDLDAAEWFRQYQSLKRFAHDLEQRLDESWHECLQEAVQVIERQASRAQSFSSLAFGRVSEVESAGNLMRDVSKNWGARNQNSELARSEKDPVENQSATSALFDQLRQFYVLRNFAEPLQPALQTNDQKFNSFLRDAQLHLEADGRWRVGKQQLFRQVVYSFYEEAEFTQSKLSQEHKQRRIRLTEEALSLHSKGLPLQASDEVDPAKSEVSPLEKRPKRLGNLSRSSSPSRQPSDDEQMKDLASIQPPQTEQVQLKSPLGKIGDSEQSLAPSTSHHLRQDQIKGSVEAAVATPGLNPSPFVRNYSSWANYLPGISIIRNHVINPLLVATERVVEQYIPVRQQQQPAEQDEAAANAQPGNPGQSQYQTSLRMLENLRTTNSDEASDREFKQMASSNYELRSRMRNLNINNELNSDMMSMSSRDGHGLRDPKQKKLKKRRFKEIDNAWDLSQVEGGQGGIIATRQRDDMSDETMSMHSRKGNNRRCIKLRYKKINRILNEMDLARARKGSAGIKEQAKIMGSFAIRMYDFHTDSLHQMKNKRDQNVIREQVEAQTAGLGKRTSPQIPMEQNSQRGTASSSFDQVDSIRFLKTNVDFYERAMLVWIKFKTLHAAMLERAEKSSQYEVLQLFDQFLLGFLLKEGQKWGQVASESMMGQASQLISSIIVTQHFASTHQFDCEFDSHKIDPCDREDYQISLFFANVHLKLLEQWEDFVVEQSAKFRQQHHQQGSAPRMTRP